MSGWSGGNFTGGYNWNTDAAGNVKILASRHQAEDDIFIAGINACIAKDGSNAFTANANLGSNKITAVAAGTLASDAPRIDQLQDGSLTYAVDTGAADAYVISLTPNETAYAGGQVIWFKAINANTGASTLAVDGLAAIDIKKNGGNALVSGDIAANQLIGVVYDATSGDFEMITMPAMIVANLTGSVTGTTITASGTLTPSKGADVASTAGVMTLGADGNYFDITGTNAITGIATLGVGTVVTLHFDGAATLTHHATDLILPGGANITTAAGDEFTFVEYASADWRCIGYALATGQSIVATAVDPLTLTTVAPATPVVKTLYEDTIVKGWLNWTYSGGAVPSIDDDVNVSSIADTNTGIIGVTFATAMSTANFACAGASEVNGQVVTTPTQATSGFSINITNDAGTNTNSDGSVLFVGNN